MKVWIAFWNILKKDIKNYYLKPPNISWGIIFPLSWALMQFIRTPELGVLSILPGIIGISVLFGATSVLAVTITFEKKSRSFDRLLLAPVSTSVMVLAKISGAVIFGMLIPFVPVIIAAFLTNLSGLKWGFIIIGITLGAVTSTLLGLLVAVSSKEVFEAQTNSNLFRFPALFLSGLFISVRSLPVVLRPMSYCIPLTYCTDILHYAVNGESLLGIHYDIMIAAVFAVLLFVMCRWQIKRKWLK